MGTQVTPRGTGVKTRVRLHTYDNTLQRGLYSFYREDRKVALLRWIRGPLSRIVRLLRAAERHSHV